MQLTVRRSLSGIQFQPFTVKWVSIKNGNPNVARFSDSSTRDAATMKIIVNRNAVPEVKCLSVASRLPGTSGYHEIEPLRTRRIRVFRKMCRIMRTVVRHCDSIATRNLRIVFCSVLTETGLRFAIHSIASCIKTKPIPDKPRHSFKECMIFLV